MYEVSFREETRFFMDVLETKGWLERAPRAILSAIFAVFAVSGIQKQRSVSITASSRRNCNERIQHIRAFEFAFAWGRCRSVFTASATRVVRR